jgi:hypothetical protein
MKARAIGLPVFVTAVGATVALASLADSGAATPGTHHRVRVRDEVNQPAVARGFLYYRSSAGNREALKRLELATGERKSVYRTTSESFSIDALRAGSGQIAIGLAGEVGSRRFETAVLGFPSDRVGHRTIASGHYLFSRGGDRSRDCGSVVSLEDVAPDGTIATEEATDPCGSASDANESTLRGHRPDGSQRELYRRAVSGAFDLVGDESTTRLVGDRLLVWSERAARVRDLRNGSVRVVRRTSARTGLFFADLSPAGEIVVGEADFRRRRLLVTVRWLRTTDQATDGRTIFRSRAVIADARFCGDRLVLWTTGRTGRQRLVVWENGRRRVAYGGRAPVGNWEVEGASCDADIYAIVFDTGSRRSTIDAFRMAPTGIEPALRP